MNKRRSKLAGVMASMMDMPEPPFSLHAAILFIIIGMIFEFIGISLNAVRLAEGALILISSHVIMGLTAFTTIKLLTDIEKGIVNSRTGIYLSVFCNVFVLLLAIRLGYANPGLAAAMIFDSIGLLLLIYPQSLRWIRYLHTNRNTW